MAENITCRIATINDLPRIVEIYNQAIRSKSATGDTNEFTVEERMHWFYKFDTNKYPLYIATKNNTIIGYSSISPYRPGRKAMDKVAEISYYIDYSNHKQGIASTLLKFVVSDCARLNIDNLLAFVLDINIPTINFLKKFNFKQLGHLPQIINLNNKVCGHYIFGLRV
jgi:L-amino acid N-acyltransferase YncA